MLNTFAFMMLKVETFIGYPLSPATIFVVTAVTADEDAITVAVISEVYPLLKNAELGLSSNPPADAYGVLAVVHKLIILAVIFNVFGAVELPD